MYDSYYEGKVAVVTGAGGRLSGPIAIHLAAKGAKVVLIGRTAAKLEKTAAAIKENGDTCYIVTADVNDEASMLAAAKEIAEKYGPCRFLINGAGGNNAKATTTNGHFSETDLSEDKPEGFRGFWDIDLEAGRQVLLTNTFGSIVPMRAFCPQMIAAGGGSIINFASMNTYCPLTNNIAYAMAKAAIANFTKWAAGYFSNPKANIRINAIAPGFFVNERSVLILGSEETGWLPRGQKVIDHTPQQRMGVPEDLLGTAEYLLDDRLSGFVTGVTIPVDGGFLTLSGV